MLNNPGYKYTPKRKRKNIKGGVTDTHVAKEFGLMPFAVPRRSSSQFQTAHVITKPFLQSHQLFSEQKYCTPATPVIHSKRLSLQKMETIDNSLYKLSNVNFSERNFLSLNSGFSSDDLNSSLSTASLNSSFSTDLDADLKSNHFFDLDDWTLSNDGMKELAMLDLGDLNGLLNLEPSHNFVSDPFQCLSDFYLSI